MNQELLRGVATLVGGGEIEARTWFLLCESENAKKSRWVQDEVAQTNVLKEFLGHRFDEP